MSKKIQLSIPVPCHENWENMTPVEKGRFCDSCQKKVIDFSRMSDREIAEFFKKSLGGSVCGRFMGDQLNRDIEIPKKRIPWVKYFFQFALPAFLISIKVNAQSKISKPDIIYTDKKRIFNDTLTLPEVVVASSPAISKVSAQSLDEQINQNSSLEKEEMNSSFVGFLGGISVCHRYVFSVDTFFKKMSNPTNAGPKENFKIFPNPVKTGSSLNIEWNQSETGSFILQLFNIQGQIVFNREIWVEDKASALNFELPQVASGNYVLKMVSKQSGKSFSEKIIIQ